MLFAVTNRDRRSIKELCWGLVLIAVWMMSAGCAENYGRLQHDLRVNAIFNRYEVLPDHTYYFSGPEGRPDAIMAILSGYVLETTQWTAFNPGDGTLKKWVDGMNFYHISGIRKRPYGFIILDAEGNQVGIWYSIWDWTAIITHADRRIEIFPPATREPDGNGEERPKMKFD